LRDKFDFHTNLKGGKTEMMHMEMSQGVQLRQEQTQLGCMDSIFPKVDEMLNQTKYQQSLEFVAWRKNMNRYRSMVDFLFCEIYTEYRDACFRFYYSDGPQLKNMPESTSEQIEKWEAVLIKSLLFAHEVLQENRSMSWVNFANKVLAG